MLQLPNLATILPTLATVPVATRLQRVVNLEHFESSDPGQLLFDRGPVRSRDGQRFTPAAPDGFPGIYAAEELMTAGSEYAGSRENWNRGACPKFVGFGIDVDLKRVLDLTDQKIRKKLGTTVEEILSPWLGVAKIHGHWPVTWNLGKAVFDHGQIDGIRFPSDKNRPKGRNVMVLTSCLSATGGTITIFNSDGSIREVLP